MRPDWRTLPFGPTLRQPDQRSCGAASLVVARLVLDESYAARAVPRFAAEVLAAHRGLTGATGPTGRLQVPWPRALGTPPWALARQLSGTGVRVRWRLSRWSRPAAYDRLLEGVRAGVPVPVYVGSRWLPRHVVLGLAAHGDAVEVYDPARGGLTRLDRAGFVGARLGLGRWDVAWFVLGR